MAFADRVTTCTDQQKAVFAERGTDPGKIAVVLNSADSNVFQPPVDGPKLWAPGDDLVLVSHGLVVERYGLDTIVRAVQFLKPDIPGIRLRILGSGEYLPQLRSLVRELDVEDEVWLAGFLPRAEMLEAIHTAHIGVVAVKRDAFRDLTHTNKMYECIAMLKPVVISETAAVRAYFDDASFAFFKSDDPADLARAIRELYHHPERARAMIEHASWQYQQYAWEIQKHVYLDAVLGATPSVPTEAQPVGAL
jgi:glycosyltransferase involved in cell wall biosynthesis